MKAFVFLAIISLTKAISQDFIDDFMEKVQEIGEKCAAETDATPDDIAELIAKKIPPSTHEGRCMIFCMQKNFKLMKNDGSVDRAGAMLALRPLQKEDPQLYQQLLKIFVTCGMRVKPVPDPCETASILAECAKNEAEAMGLDETLLA